ncbi:MAG: hypothetical protein SFV17_05960 [Candidatus Obscuribacter sp.]|nr:hypothetical protein [Candidatus Obscuribacter sp.]
MPGKRKRDERQSSFSYDGPVRKIGSNSQSPVAGLIFGGIFAFVGVSVVLLACGAFPVPESSFKAPHWVVGAVGGLFTLAGLNVILQGLGVSPNSIVFRLLTPVMLLCFGAPFAWIVFGDSHAPLEARILVGIFFAFFALLFGAAAVIGLNSGLMRRLARDNPQLLERISELEKRKRGG